MPTLAQTFTNRRVVNALQMLEGDTTPQHLVRFCRYTQPQADALIWAMGEGMNTVNTPHDELCEAIRSRILRKARAKVEAKKAVQPERRSVWVSGWQMPPVGVS